MATQTPRTSVAVIAMIVEVVRTLSSSPSLKPRAFRLRQRERDTYQFEAAGCPRGRIRWPRGWARTAAADGGGCESVL
jgi:hypothetical protein